MKRLMTILIVLAPLLTGGTKDQYLKERYIGTKEIRASIQVKIIIPDRKNIMNKISQDTILPCPKPDLNSIKKDR